MAKIRLESYLEEINGRIGNIVYYHCRGREYARIHVNPSNPRTECQQAVRGLFALAVLSWQQLAPAEKEEFNRRARYKPMSGYNLYISQFMKQNMPVTEKKGLPGGIQKRFASRTSCCMASGLSVPAPFPLPDPLYTAPIQPLSRSGPGL